MKEKLQKARKYEENFGDNEDGMKKAEFHVCSRIGWMNDPNGLSEYNGEYHLFYQYHPYSTSWGPMHWGHVKTKDFIKWEYLPCALAPDTEYDGQGCFSGSAVEWNGKHVLVYTGVVDKTEGNNHLLRQTQCVAIGDGINYEKINQNPVITSTQLPKGSSLEDFRDPKIYLKDNAIHMVVGSRASDTSGQVLLYRTKDLINWEFITILDQSNNAIGKMWECPDYFEMDKKQILIFSPQEILANKEFHNGNCNAGMIGHFDEKEQKFVREHIQAMDYGLDFYAAQTLGTKDGRRIMIGWMQSWDNHFYPGTSAWSGMMSIPRELSIKNNQIYQKPVREIANYYKDTVCFENQHIGNEIELPGMKGRHIDMNIELVGQEYEFFTVKVAIGNGKYTSVSYDRKRGLIETDRTYSGITRDIITTRKHKVMPIQGKLQIRMILDSYSMELFINDGEIALSMIFFTELDADGITFQSDGNAIANICFNKISMI